MSLSSVVKASMLFELVTNGEMIVDVWDVMNIPQRLLFSKPARWHLDRRFDLNSDKDSKKVADRRLLTFLGGFGGTGGGSFFDLVLFSGSSCFEFCSMNKLKLNRDLQFSSW